MSLRPAAATDQVDEAGEWSVDDAERLAQLLQHRRLLLVSCWLCGLRHPAHEIIVHVYDIYTGKIFHIKQGLLQEHIYV